MEKFNVLPSELFIKWLYDNKQLHIQTAYVETKLGLILYFVSDQLESFQKNHNGKVTLHWVETSKTQS